MTAYRHDFAARATERQAAGSRVRISVASMVLTLGALLAIDQLLLWRFLGLIGDGVVASLAAIVIGAAIWTASRPCRW